MLRGNIYDLYNYAAQHNIIKIKTVNDIPAYISNIEDLFDKHYNELHNIYDMDSWMTRGTVPNEYEIALTIADAKIWKNITDTKEKNDFYLKHAVEICNTLDISYYCETFIPEGEYIVKYIKDNGHGNDIFNIVEDITHNGRFNNYNMFWLKYCNYCDNHTCPEIDYDIIKGD